MAQLRFEEADPVGDDAQAIVRDGMTEEVLGQAEEVGTSQREAFWTLMTAMNRVSAVPPKYRHACDILLLDSADPLIRPAGREPFRPFPWQIMAAVWIHVMEDSPLRGCLMADDMGLGKTLTALLLINRDWILPAAAADLRRWIGLLNPHNLQTAAVVIRTTYTTWLICIIYEDGGEALDRTSEPISGNNDDEDEDNDNDLEVSIKVLNRLRSNCVDLFD